MKTILFPILASLLGASAQNAASETSTVSSTQSATMQSPPSGAIAGRVGQPNITSVFAGQENVSMLVDVLGKDRFSDLYDEITSRLVSFTLLAPSNQAFKDFLGTDAGKMFQSNDAFARDLLSYHLISGQVTSQDIPKGGILDSNWNQTLDFVPSVNLSASGPSGQYVGSIKDDDKAYFVSGFMRNSTIQQADILFNRGYVHVIDKVLTPPGNLSETLIAGSFQALSGAFEMPNIKTQSALSGNGEQFTLFAPTDQAFYDIGSLVPNLKADNLTDILKYHAVGEVAVFANQLKDGMKIATLQGNDLTVSIRNIDNEELVFINGARIVAPNLITNQGVVHGIDKVLNPDADVMAQPNATEGIFQYPAASGTGTNVPLTSGQPTATSPIPLPADATGISTSSAAGVPVATSGPAFGVFMAGAALVAAL